MNDVAAKCILSGREFFVSRMKWSDNVLVETPNDPGEVGVSGRYLHKSTPTGSCIISIKEESSLESLVDYVGKLLPALRETGVQEIEFYVSIIYSDQGNWELNPNIIGKLSNCGAHLLVSFAKQGNAE